MILDKFRDRYSFNFLAFSGWITCFVYIYTYFRELHPFSYNEQLGFPLLFIMAFLIGIEAIFILLFLVIVFLEVFLKIKITTEKFLKSKLILWFQNIGLIFIGFPIAFINSYFAVGLLGLNLYFIFLLTPLILILFAYVLK